MVALTEIQILKLLAAKLGVGVEQSVLESAIAKADMFNVEHILDNLRDYILNEITASLNNKPEASWFTTNITNALTSLLNNKPEASWFNTYIVTPLSTKPTLANITDWINTNVVTPLATKPTLANITDWVNTNVVTPLALKPTLANITDWITANITNIITARPILSDIVTMIQNGTWFSLDAIKTFIHANDNSILRQMMDEVNKAGKTFFDIDYGVTY